MNPDRDEIRVLGCLIEKQRTTPDAYPLSLNALRLACNQSTNREPVLVLTESDVRGALDRLGRRGWTRSTSWAGSRTMKYKQLLDKALGLSPPQLALLGVLMLRGAQTLGELRGRSERLHSFGSLAEVEQALAELVERELAARLPRRPGQKEGRYEQLVGGEPKGDELEHAPVEAVAGRQPPDRVAELEERLGRLEDEVRRLREELGA